VKYGHFVPTHKTSNREAARKDEAEMKNFDQIGNSIYEQHIVF
jgi:hypothetical protein